MAKNTPAFQFYPADFLIGTSTMSAAAVGCYIRLLSHQWAMRHLPEDHEVLARLCFVTRSEFDRVWTEIESKFELGIAGCIRNPRLHSIMLEVEKLSETRRRAGSKGGRANAKQKGKQNPSKRRLKTEDRSLDAVVDDWMLPEDWDTPAVRKALDDWSAMRDRIQKPIVSKSSTSKLFNQFTSPEHLIAVCEVCEANGWQVLRPDYVDMTTKHSAPVLKNDGPGQQMLKEFGNGNF